MIRGSLRYREGGVPLAGEVRYFPQPRETSWGIGSGVRDGGVWLWFFPG